MRERENDTNKHLSQEEEIHLAKLIEVGRAARVTLAKNPDLNRREKLALEAQIRKGFDARTRLIVTNLGLVGDSARRYLGRGMEYWDIFQNGTEGLIRAVDKFDYRRGHRFSTLAVWWIDSRISEKFGKLKNKDANGRHLLSLDTPLENEDGNETPLGELIRENALSVEEGAEASIRNQGVIEAFENLLTPQQKEIILNHYFRGMPVVEIAEEMGIHRVSVHKLEKKALDVVRGSPFAAALKNSLD